MNTEQPNNLITISKAKLNGILDRALKAASIDEHATTMVRCSVEMSLVRHLMSEIEADFANALKRLKETEE